MLWTRMNADVLLDSAPDDGRRARFEAVRRRVFFEMRHMAGRWRFALIVPFHALTLGTLATHGFPRERLLIQALASTAVIVSLTLSDKLKARLGRFFLFFSGFAILTAIANTGGLASPLIMSLVPFFAGIAINPELENRRRYFVVKFVMLFGLMAFCARVCTLPAELAPASTPFLVIAFSSAAMSLLAVYTMGKAISAAYERITLELAERREELCDENEGRTRALEGIAARLAHEVKNPLAAIKGLSTHMARSAEDAKVKERLTIVASEAERLQEIVDGFLSFSRGLDELSIGATRPFEMVRELSLLLETRAADAGVTLEVKGSRELAIDADAKKLRQALLNLVLNAMQASSKGATVTLEVAKQACGTGAAVIKIMDRGAGMTPDILDRIRKPYFTTKEGGSGLGIAIARGIIEQHGGTLRFESTSGRGTTAIVMLPQSANGKRFTLPNPCRMAEAQLSALAAVVEKADKPAAEKPVDIAPAFAHATPEKA